jgi:hypothetical protein
MVKYLYNMQQEVLNSNNSKDILANNKSTPYNDCIANKLLIFFTKCKNSKKKIFHCLLINNILKETTINKFIPINFNTPFFLVSVWIVAQN